MHIDNIAFTSLTISSNCFFNEFINKYLIYNKYSTL